MNSSESLQTGNAEKPTISNALLILCQGFIAVNSLGQSSASSRDWWIKTFIPVGIQNGDAANLESSSFYQRLRTEMGREIGGSLKDLILWIRGDKEFEGDKLVELVKSAEAELHPHVAE